jgi:DNA adenine methylase
VTPAQSKQIPRLSIAGAGGQGVNGMVAEVDTTPLKAPWPYFGGKSRAASLVWERLGDVRNYVEPFCGTAAVLLRRPHAGQVETVNDASSQICNFWRAVQRDPEAVAAHADHPVNEVDLHARHKWLVYSRKARAALARVKVDPDYYNAKVAGWWAWGACCWIGSGWCDHPEWEGRGSALSGGGGTGRGVNAGLNRIVPPPGVHVGKLTRKLPEVDE